MIDWPHYLIYGPTLRRTPVHKFAKELHNCIAYMQQWFALLIIDPVL